MDKIIRKFKNPAEFVCIILMLVVSLYFFIGSLSFSDGDEIFPLLTSGATIIFLVAYTIKTIFQKSEEETERENKKTNVLTKNVVISILLFIGYVILVKLFGFFIATAVFVVAYPLSTGYKSKKGIVILFIVNVVLVLLFQKLMGTTLSRGILVDLTNLFF